MLSILPAWKVVNSKFGQFIASYTHGGFSFSQILKKDSMQISLGRARENRHNHLTAIMLFARLLQSSPRHSATTDTYRKTLQFHQPNSRSYSSLIGNRHNSIDKINPECVRLKTGSEAFNTMWPGPPT